MKYFVSLVLAVSLVFVSAGCESLEKNNLIEELRAEIEAKTEELNRINEELEDVNHILDSMKYERDAFLEENIILRDERKMYEERIVNFEAAMEENFNNYIQKRRNLGELIIYLKEIGATPYFDQEILETHKDAMREYINDAGMGTFMVSEDEYTEFILSIIHVKTGSEVAPGIFMYQTVILGDSSPVEYPSQFSIPEDSGSDLFDKAVLIVTETDSGPEVTYFGLPPEN